MTHRLGLVAGHVVSSRTSAGSSAGTVDAVVAQTTQAERVRASLEAKCPKTWARNAEGFPLLAGMPHGELPEHPTWLLAERSKGTHTWDIDGNKYLDLHGFGASEFALPPPARTGWRPLTNQCSMQTGAQLKTTSRSLGAPFTVPRARPYRCVTLRGSRLPHPRVQPRSRAGGGNGGDGERRDPQRLVAHRKYPSNPSMLVMYGSTLTDCL